MVVRYRIVFVIFFGWLILWVGSCWVVLVYIVLCVLGVSLFYSGVVIRFGDMVFM